MSRPLSFVAVLALGGCMMMGLQDLRETSPERTATVANASYSTLADCVAKRLQSGPSSVWFLEPGDLVYQVSRRTEQQRAMVTGFMRTASAAPLIDLTFLQRGADVLVESRLGRLDGAETGSPAAERIDSQVWPVVEECTSGKSG